MKRIILALTTAAALTLTACAGAPGAEQVPVPTTSQATETSAPAPTPAADTTESFEPMTAEELETTGEPMDNDGPATDAEAQNIADYNECVADLEADYEPDMGMTDDTSICDDILQMSQEMDTQTELLEGLNVPCMYQLEQKRPELFEGLMLEQIVEDPTIIKLCAE